MENPLGIEPIGRLLAKYAIPSVISLLINSLYSMVDQIFIGQPIAEKLMISFYNQILLEKIANDTGFSPVFVTEAAEYATVKISLLFNAEPWEKKHV